MSRSSKNRLKSKRKKKQQLTVTPKKQTFVEGVYCGIEYKSRLELATILHCEELGLKIKRYDLPPISYFCDTKQRQRKYYPDFIVNDWLIVETKGFWPRKKVVEILNKHRALDHFCSLTGRFACLMVQKDDLQPGIVDKAKKLHRRMKNEIQ